MLPKKPFVLLKLDKAAKIDPKEMADIVESIKLCRVVQAVGEAPSLEPSLENDNPTNPR